MGPKNLRLRTNLLEQVGGRVGEETEHFPQMRDLLTAEVRGSRRVERSSNDAAERAARIAPITCVQRGESQLLVLSGVVSGDTADSFIGRLTRGRY